MPPAAADMVPVVKSSRSVCPGSSKWACMSMAPGSTTRPEASISSSAPLRSAWSATAATRPSSITTSAGNTPYSVASVPPAMTVRLPLTVLSAPVAAWRGPSLASAAQGRQGACEQLDRGGDVGLVGQLLRPVADSAVAAADEQHATVDAAPGQDPGIVTAAGGQVGKLQTGGRGRRPDGIADASAHRHRLAAPDWVERDRTAAGRRDLRALLIEP